VLLSVELGVEEVVVEADDASGQEAFWLTTRKGTLVIADMISPDESVQFASKS
jgi:hypothetical protein